MMGTPFLYSLLILLALSSIPELTSVAPFYHPWAHVHAHDLFFFFAQLEPNLMCGQQQMESLLQRIHCVVQSNDLCSRHMFCFRTLQMSSNLTCNAVFPTLCQRPELTNTLNPNGILREVNGPSPNGRATGERMTGAHQHMRREGDGRATGG